MLTGCHIYLFLFSTIEYTQFKIDIGIYCDTGFITCRTACFSF